MEKDYAILRLNLIASIPAYELSRLTSVINDMYDIFLGMDPLYRYAKRSPIFLPGEEEKLYIKKALIGTPNCIEFLGIREHLIDAALFLGKNFNSRLNLKNATILNIEKSDSMLIHMERIKELFDQKVLGDSVVHKEESKRNLKYAKGKIIDLKWNQSWDGVLGEKITDYMKYVKDISGISQNIIEEAEITILKSIV